MGMWGIVFAHQATLSRTREARVAACSTSTREAAKGERKWTSKIEVFPDDFHYRMCSPVDLLHFAPLGIEVEQAAMTASQGRESAA